MPRIPARIAATILALAASVCASTSGASDAPAKEVTSFHYLEYRDNSLQSMHAIRLSLAIPEGYRRVDPLNHQATFNGHPFNVSVAALIGNDSVILVHAEQVTDDSGFLDYSYLPPAKLSGLDFFASTRCVTVPVDVIEETADLRYLKSNGFDFSKPTYLKQFFMNTGDGNSEYVLTFAQRVDDCLEDTIGDDFVRRFNEELERIVVLSETVRTPRTTR